MALIDIKAVKDAATAEIREELVKKATKALTAQMRVVELARQALKAEEMKLADIERQIEDGTL